jgi:cold shock protein
MRFQDGRMYKGTVVWMDSRKGFGFIKPDKGDKDIFCYWSDIVMEGFKVVYKNQRVEYEVGKAANGKPKAIQIKVL